MSKQNCPSQNPQNVEELFHWNTEPEDRFKPLNCRKDENYKTVRVSSIQSVGYLIQLLKDHFSDIDKFRGSILEDFLTNNTIDISGVAFSDLDTQGIKPRIILEYAGRKPQQDFAFYDKIGYDMGNSCQSFYCRWQIGFTVYVLSTEYTETLAFAEEVRNFYHRFQRTICEELCWKDFRVIEEQKPQYVDELGCYKQTISLMAVVPEIWDVTEAAPKLKTVSFNSSI